MRELTRSQAARRRGIVLAALAAISTVLAAGCAGDRDTDPSRAEPQRREVVVDHGTAKVVDLRSATVQAAPGDVVVLRNANPGGGEDDESPVHHLFTSAGPQLPPLFTPVGEGHVPNGGVWGLCRGGDAADATQGCPVPPVEGPGAYDGTSYFSLGSLLPSDEVELPLDEELPLGIYRFTCAVHPHMHVDVEVVEDPAPAPTPAPLDAGLALRRAGEERLLSEPRSAVVLLGPLLAEPSAEVLTAVPEVVRIPVGGTVVWRVAGRSPHTVELGLQGPPHLADTVAADTVPLGAPDGRWDGTRVVRSGVLSTDPAVDRREFALTFTQKGTYRAHDRFHADVVTLVHVG